jgi:hypothetical protein
MTKKSREFTVAEKDKLSLLFTPLLMLNMALRAYNHVVASDKQDPRWISDNAPQILLKHGRAVAQLHSVPNTAVDEITQIFKEVRLPYCCDQENIEPHRKRALFYIDVNRATTMGIGSAADAIIERVQEVSGRNFGEILQQITKRSKIGMILRKGKDEPSDEPPPPRNFNPVPKKDFVSRTKKTTRGKDRTPD